MTEIYRTLDSPFTDDQVGFIWIDTFGEGRYERTRYYASVDAKPISQSSTLVYCGHEHRTEASALLCLARLFRRWRPATTDTIRQETS